MAFLKKDLTRLAGGNGFTLWHYKSAVDAIADINTAAYFTGDAVNMLGVRDLMIIVDTATPTTHLVSVLTNDGTTVDIADGTVLAETDGD
jgi:hypothetical protein